MKRLKWTMWVVLLMGLVDLASSQVVEDNPAFFTTPASCTTNADCAATANALCAKSAGAVTGQCKCDGDLGWLKVNEVCVVVVGLSQKCDKTATVCSTANSACSPSGENNKSYKCKCVDGYVAVTRGVQTPGCFQIVTTQKDPLCKTCEDNDGTCYLDSAIRKCYCPTSRSGDDCQIVHVNVTCDVDKFEMQVCYDPHPGIDFPAGSKMYTYTHGNDEACKGKMEDGTGTCKATSYRITLPLDSQRRARCGTSEVSKDASTRTFESTIVVDLPPGVTGNAPVFDCFCSYKKSTNVKNGIGVVVLPGNDRGIYTKPDLSFSVLNVWRSKIALNVALSLHDNFILKVDLVNDGTYTALRIDECTASTSPTMPDPKAETERLVEAGCPAADQNRITDVNNWRHIGETRNSIQTGLVKMFKLSIGRTIFIHCTVGLCLKGSEVDCAPATCSPPAGTGGENNVQRRKRRAATATYRDAEITRELRWYDPDEKQKTVAELQAENNVVVMNTIGFAVLLTILVLLLVVFMVLSVLMFYRQKPKPYSIDDHIPEKPQRFALPRIARNNMRV